MASHALSLHFDDATGELAIEHRCTVDVAGVQTSHGESIELADTEEILGTLQAILDTNKIEMEKRATHHGVMHASALAGKTVKGLTRLSMGGKIGVAGNTDVKG